MERFYVKNKNKKEIAKINYNANSNVWSLKINKNIDLSTCPVFLYSMVKNNKYLIDNEGTLRFIRSRIIPSSRQNINAFLKKYKISHYNEYDLLKLSKGKCCLDDCYIDYVK